MPANPLIPDREAEFLLYEASDAGSLCELPAFAEHSRESFDLYLDSCRRFAREQLFPAYKPMDEQPPRFADGRIRLHPLMQELYPKLVELGVVSATRPVEVGGGQLPMTVAAVANLYLMAANLNVTALALLSGSAGHLLEAFGSDAIRELFLAPLYDGVLAATVRAAPSAITGSKIFISGADQDLTENIVNMTLARIDGAPAGIRGVSLFAVPNRRPEQGALRDNDVSITQAIHKIGWRGLPSLAISYGDRGDCHGWLVGEPHQGIPYMFQMMNEARLMIAANATATAAVAYQESLTYARERTQGRAASAKDASVPQIPLVEHADVRRMLLRQKAIVEGSASLLLYAARCADLAQHAGTEEERRRAALLLDTLTPVAKSFPAEFGFEANALAIQIHGGYGYSSEYLPEAWLRDQKLNSIHEGTTGIQSIDLLGRKVRAADGLAFGALVGEMRESVEPARRAALPADWCDALAREIARLEAVTGKLVLQGRADREAMLAHSADYLLLVCIVVVAWRWLEMARLAAHGLGRGEDAFYRGKLQAAQYWIRNELPRAAQLAELCESGEDSYVAMESDWF